MCSPAGFCMPPGPRPRRIAMATTTTGSKHHRNAEYSGKVSVGPPTDTEDTERPPYADERKAGSARGEWFRSSTTTRRGYIRGATFGEKEIEYAVVDGLLMFEGD